MLACQHDILPPLVNLLPGISFLEVAVSQGRKSAPERKLFLAADEVYGHIPRDHFYERLEALLDLEFVRKLTLPLYKDGGRPSLDPVVFFKAMFIGFFENVVHDLE